MNSIYLSIYLSSLYPLGLTGNHIDFGQLIRSACRAEKTHFIGIKLKFKLRGAVCVNTSVTVSNQTIPCLLPSPKSRSAACVQEVGVLRMCYFNAALNHTLETGLSQSSAKLLHNVFLLCLLMPLYSLFMYFEKALKKRMECVEKY